MGFRPEKMSIAKISVKKDLGRQFLNQICNKYELEIIDLVKVAQSEPLALSDVESRTIDLHAEFVQMVELLDGIGSKSKGNMNLEDLSLTELNDKAQSLLEKTQPLMKELETIKVLREEISSFEHIINSLKEVKDLNIQNIQDIGEGSHFYAILGFLKGIHQYRLEMALDQLTGGDFVFIPVPSKKAKVICLVGVMKSYQAALNRLLSGLGFEEVSFPKELQGSPLEAVEQAKTKLTEHKQELKVLKQRIKELVDEDELSIRAMEEQLALEENRLKILQRTQLRKEHYIIWAWLWKKRSKKFLKAVTEFDSSINLEIIEPKLESSEFPTKVRNNIYSRSFEGLVYGFGVPGYKEWDPTKFLSILIPIFFGIMFGDVIDGLVVFLLGLYGLSLSPKRYSKNAMLAELQTYIDKGGPVLVTIGSTAMIFGFLFGSYRGLGGHHALEVGLPILWFSPEIEGGQFALLELAIFIGCIVIGSALIIQFLGSWSHNKSEAIFLPGMFFLFYVGLVFLVFTFGPNPTLWLTATEGKFDLRALQTIAQSQEKIMHHHHIDFTSPVGAIFESLNAAEWGIPVFPIPLLDISYPLALLVVPLFLSSIYHFRHGMDGIGELLDYIITMISNTISFARIFAYTMVHGSLSLVFIQLFSGNAHTLFEFLPGMILGGFVVIPLELLVSFLQSLRLCWVEFFSKIHFQGSGYLFQPFKENRLFTTSGN
ncbi:MAG: V-type ATPase 116kDa subunit family protein [Candidatus Hodarchaeota archaeon]